MKIAILGTRGIPARYGGFETFAEKLSTRLSKRGHRVTVFSRCSWKASRPPSNYRGVEVRYSRTIYHKYLETPLASLHSMLTIHSGEFDVVILCNAANSPFAFLLNLKKIPVLINVDGVERRRSKWNALGKLWYQLGEYCSCLFADRIIADAVAIEDYYRQRYRILPAVIAYGAEVEDGQGSDILDKFGLQKNRFILYVSRLEPENNALGVIQAYKSLETDIPLVIVGDAPYSSEYKSLLHEASGEGVIFTGYQFGADYHCLQSACLLYIQATEVGGTHPALIEAMAHGNAILANGTPENLEVLSGAGNYYLRNDFASLAVELANLIGQPEKIKELGQRARKRAAEVYSWEAITDSYESLCNRFMKKEAVSIDEAA